MPEFVQTAVHIHLKQPFKSWVRMNWHFTGRGHGGSLSMERKRMSILEGCLADLILLVGEL